MGVYEAFDPEVIQSAPVRDGQRVLVRGLMIEDQMRERNPNLDPQGVRNLDPRLFADHHAPDFVVAFGLIPPTETFLQSLIKHHSLKAGSQTPIFTYRVIASLDVFAFSMIRPEIFWHRFAPITEFDRKTQGVHILQKVAVTAPPPAEAPQ